MTSEVKTGSDDSKMQRSDDGKTQRKMISPYDITPNDNPGLIITQVQLKGENYDEWARSLRTALRARKKYGFVDGTIERPDDSSYDLEDWWTNNSLLVSWIRNTIEPGLRMTISHMEVAKDLWEDIKERFSVADGPRVQQLKMELADCRQRGLTIGSYYGKLKLLWDELANYEQMPTCQCGKCTCNLGPALEKKREEEKIHQLLMGLDETVYGTTRSNLLAQDPLPSMNKIYSTLVREEGMRTTTQGKENHGDAMAFAVQAGSSSRGRNEGRDKNMICNNCGRSGHEADNCFQLISYPEWWGDRSRGTGRGTKRGKGLQPTSMSSGRGRGTPAKANTIQAMKSTATITDGDKVGSSGLSSEQWQTLVNLLNINKTGADEKLIGKNSLAQ